MSKRKSGIGLLGLLVVVALGVMAFASSAQALTPEFLIAKKLPAAGLDATFTAVQKGRSTLLVEALNTEFNCEKFTVNKGLIGSATDAEGELTYEECTALELKTPLAEITPCTVGLENNKKIIATGLVLPAELNNGEPALLVDKVKALIKLNGIECPLPLDNTVTGELCLKIDNNDTVEPLVLASKAIQEECRPRLTLEGTESSTGTFKDKLSYGGQTAFADGTACVKLIGPHAGLTLGVSLQ